jgi:hypothetical protein
MQWLSITYDKHDAGKTRDGFNIDRTIFAIQHNEDYSHDLVHYYVYRVRKGPHNGYAEEGVAYYLGNAYYTDAQGQMITVDRLKTDLRSYLKAHPGLDMLALFRQNQRGLFGPAKEISARSTLSAIIAATIEKKYGVDGILKPLNCGAGEADYFAVTQSLAGINPANFNQQVAELLGKQPDLTGSPQVIYTYPRFSRYLAPASKASSEGTKKSNVSARRLVTLNAKQTASASSICSGDTPAVIAAMMSSALIACSRVSLPNKVNVALSGGSTDAVFRSVKTLSILSASPYAAAETALCAFLQNAHSFVREI